MPPPPHPHHHHTLITTAINAWDRWESGRALTTFLSPSAATLARASPELHLGNVVPTTRLSSMPCSSVSVGEIPPLPLPLTACNSEMIQLPHSEEGPCSSRRPHSRADPVVGDVGDPASM